MTPTVELPERVVHVTAPRELVYEVVAAAGREIERRSDTERVVEFETRSGRRRILTTELVLLEPPALIRYRWLHGPLLDVEETLAFGEVEGGTELRYRGRFAMPSGPFARIGAPMVRRRFDRAVRRHLAHAKQAAEARAVRSKVHPRETT